MTPEQFCYWLQGRAEMQPTNPPNFEEWTIICEHLQSVFRKEASQEPSMREIAEIFLKRHREIPAERSDLTHFGNNEPFIC